MIKNLDILFVIDSSEEMALGFDKLRDLIKHCVVKLQDVVSDSLCLGLLAYNTELRNGCRFYRNTCIHGNCLDNMKILYGSDEEAKGSLFTRSGNVCVDIETFCRAIDGVKCSGSADSLFALDCAADFPFRPLQSAARMVVMITRGKFESNFVSDSSPIEKDSLIERIMTKLQKRNLAFHLYAPESAASEIISEFGSTSVFDIPVLDQRGSN